VEQQQAPDEGRLGPAGPGILKMDDAERTVNGLGLLLQRMLVNRIGRGASLPGGQGPKQGDDGGKATVHDAVLRQTAARPSPKIFFTGA
jgi:hypothetical protein